MRLKKSLKVWGQKKWGPGTERETRSSSSERSWTSLLNYYKYSKLLNGLSSCPLQKAGGLKIVPNHTPINYQTFLILFKIFIKPFKTFLICFGIFSYIFIWFYSGFLGYKGLTKPWFESIMHAPYLDMKVWDRGLVVWPHYEALYKMCTILHFTPLSSILTKSKKYQ